MGHLLQVPYVRNLPITGQDAHNYCVNPDLGGTLFFFLPEFCVVLCPPTLPSHKYADDASRRPHVPCLLFLFTPLRVISFQALCRRHRHQLLWRVLTLRGAPSPDVMIIWICSPRGFMTLEVCMLFTTADIQISTEPSRYDIIAEASWICSHS